MLRSCGIARAAFADTWPICGTWPGLRRLPSRRTGSASTPVLHAIQLAIEASVEIATHICAADNLGTPSSYAEAFDLIEKATIVDSALADDLRRMARFRNRIVHFYGDIDLRMVYHILQDRLGDFDRYLVAIERYLTRQP